MHPATASDRDPVNALKLVLWGLLALLLLAVLGLSLFISTFDPNSYRQLLSASVARATGRQLEIDGELSVTVWPEIGLRAERLSLANPPGFGAQGMLQIDALEVTVALLPLLQRKVQISHLVLYSPTLVLEQGSPGSNNWSDLQEHFGRSNTGAVDGLTMEADSIRVKDATISLQQPDHRISLSQLNAVANFTGDNKLWLAADGSLRANAGVEAAAFSLRTGVAAGAARTLLHDVEFTLAMPLPVATLGGGSETLSLTIPAIALDPDWNHATIERGTARIGSSIVSFDGKFSNLLNAAQLDGTFTAQGANPGALLELAGIKLPNGLMANRLGPFDLSAALTARLTGNEAPSVLAHHFSANLAALNVHTEGKLLLNSAGTATGELTVAPVDLLALTSALPEIFGSSVFSRADRKTNTDTAAIPTLQNLQTAFKWSPKNSAGPARLNLGNTRFDALGIAGTLQGETQLTQPVATTSLAIDLLKFSPKQVLTYFLKPVKTADPTALSSASGKVSFSQDAAGSHFRDLNIALDNSRLRGAISLLTAPQPTLRFDTTLDTLDLAGYLPPAEKNIRTDGSLTNYGALGRLPLPGEFLRAYDLSGSVRIEQLRFSGLQFTKAAARLTLGNGAATLDGLSARLYGGSFVGSVRSKAGLNQAPGTEVGPEISVTGDLQDVNVQLLLQALSNANEFTGRGDMRIELAGRGNTLLEATRSAAGDISLQLRNGTYTGINIGHELCKLYNRLRNKPAPPAPANNSTRFSTFSASAIVTNGAAQTSDLIASNNYLKLSGNGLVNLAEASINYSLDIELTGPIEETNCDTLSPFIGSRIPVRLTGTLANPSLQPDFGKLARREIRRQVEDRLTEKLLDLLGKKITGPTPQPWPEPER